MAIGTKRISLGLQGGGSLGAFGWGVLDRLLAEERLEIAAISGTSAGGVNAAVVGVLGAAWYDPVWTSAIHSKADFAIALAAFGLLTLAKTSPLIVVILIAAAGWVLSLY